MPRVKIETSESLDRTSARELMNDVMDVIVKELRLLPDDRNVSFVAHEPDFFIMKPPYRLLSRLHFSKDAAKKSSRGSTRR